MALTHVHNRERLAQLLAQARDLHDGYFALTHLLDARRERQLARVHVREPQRFMRLVEQHLRALGDPEETLRLRVRLYEAGGQPVTSLVLRRQVVERGCETCGQAQAELTTLRAQLRRSEHARRHLEGRVKALEASLAEHQEFVRRFNAQEGWR